MSQLERVKLLFKRSPDIVPGSEETPPLAPISELLHGNPKQKNLAILALLAQDRPKEPEYQPEIINRKVYPSIADATRGKANKMFERGHPTSPLVTEKLSTQDAITESGILSAVRDLDACATPDDKRLAPIGGLSQESFQELKRKSAPMLTRVKLTTAETILSSREVEPDVLVGIKRDLDSIPQDVLEDSQELAATYTRAYETFAQKVLPKYGAEAPNITRRMEAIPPNAEKMNPTELGEAFKAAWEVTLDAPSAVYHTENLFPQYHAVMSRAIGILLRQNNYEQTKVIISTIDDINNKERGTIPTDPAWLMQLTELAHPNSSFPTRLDKLLQRKAWGNLSLLLKSGREKIFSHEKSK